MSLDRLIESRIQDATAAGAFEGLPGAGKPLAIDHAEELAGESWLGFKVLRNAEMLPPWLTLAREIERDLVELDAIDRRHAEWVAIAAASGDGSRHLPAIRQLRARYERCARDIRARQDQFNLDAPSIRLERPALWVDYHLERLDARLRDAGLAGQPAPPTGAAEAAPGA